MFRHCLVATSEVKAVKKADGSWTVEGVGAEQYANVLKNADKLFRPFNSTFYITMDPHECLEKIASNQSDGSNHLLPIETMSSHYHAPEAMFPGKVQFLTGYNRSEAGITLQDEEEATVLTNILMLRPQVYEVSALLLFTFVVLITVKLRIFYPHQLVTKWWLKRITFFTVLRRELSGLFHLSSNDFKLITFLYAVLYFYLANSFMSVYSTNQVITKKPNYPTSYQESLDYETSLVFLYNQFVIVSSDFRDAPAGSLKAKIWVKLVASGKMDQFRIDGQSTSFTALPSLVKRIANEIQQRKSIAVASSITIPLLKALACGFSPDGELWFLKIFADHSEPEIIYGFTLSKTFHGSRIIRRSFKRTFQTHIMAHDFELSFDVTNVISQIAGTSREHRWKQHLACTNEKALDGQVHVGATPLFYFKYLIFICVYGWAMASLFLLTEISCGSRKRRRRRRLVTHSPM